MSQPRLASSAIVDRDGRILLVRRGNPPAADLYAFPGVAPNPRNAGRNRTSRTRKETGIIGRNPRLFETYELLPEAGVAGSHYLLSVFRVDADGDSLAEARSDAIDAAGSFRRNWTTCRAPQRARLRGKTRRVINAEARG